jgi:hypothetical protein
MQRILKKGECNVTEGKPFSMPQKKKHRKKTKTEVDKSDKCVICKTINEFHVTEGQHLTIKR